MSAKTTPKGLKEVTYNDAVARSKEYFGGDELAAHDLDGVARRTADISQGLYPH